MISDNWHEDVLKFWFEELEPKQWYMSSKELDASITERFKQLVLALSENLPSNVKDQSEKCLAAIICFDQFSRNIFRGEGKAFAFDDLALELAVYIIDNGWDKAMDPTRKQFAYMPFMHSEDIAVQKRALVIFKNMGEKTFEYAKKHHDIIEKFGRYPHRNACLGRENTPEEIEYLKDAERFGQ